MDSLDQSMPSCAQQASQRLRRCGFTMVELTIVLLLMALIAAMAIPTYYDSISRQHVSAAARRLKSDLELARQLAIDSGSPTTIAFDVGDEIYRMPPTELAVGAYTKSRVNLLADPYHTQILTAKVGDQPWVMFDRFGLPHAEGEIELQSGPYQKYVSINGQTGEIIIADSSAG